MKIALPACVSVPLMVIAGVLPIPGHVDQPPLIAVTAFAAIGFAVAALGGFSLRSWLALLDGVLVGTALSVLAVASFAQTYTFADWFIPRAEWIGGLSFTLAEVIAAAGVAYVTGGLTVARARAGRGDPIRPKRVTLVAAAAVSSLLAAPALAVALSATVVSDDVLAPINREIADISILADGTLRISEHDTLRAGSNWYMLSNATHRSIRLTMVPINDQTDVDRLLAGDQMGFAFMSFAEATAGQEPTLGRLDVERGRYAVYVDPPMPKIEEGPIVGPG
ncbi:MAG: hypothetical protein M3R05_06600, partial [Chloroflexota bacterium]|nr:hypothetical protein [Chloroflexota bacterium]